MEKFIDTQEWVPIHTLPGFEACIEYYVNKEGQVRSTKQKKDRILKTKKHKAGYPMVKLTQRIGKGKVIDVCVHKLVAFAFLGKPPTPYGNAKGCTIIDHIDEDKINPHADNLRWVSWKENNSKREYKRRPKNTPEQAEAAKERQRIAKRDYMRRKRASGHADRVRSNLTQRKRVK